MKQREHREQKWTDFEGVGGLLELDFEFHHGGGLAGPDDCGQGANRRHGLGQIGLLPPVVELVDDAKRLSRLGRGGGGDVGLGRGLVVGVAADGGLGLGEPVAGDDAVVGGPGLVVGGDLRV